MIILLSEARGGTPYSGLYGEAPPERGTFSRLQVYKRVGISQVEVYKRVGKSVVSQQLFTAFRDRKTFQGRAWFNT